MAALLHNVQAVHFSLIDLISELIDVISKGFEIQMTKSLL